jgi:hypothetical protein
MKSDRDADVFCLSKASEHSSLEYYVGLVLRYVILVVISVLCVQNSLSS